MPSIPLSRLTPEQVFRVAQVVDTALFKLYLVVRPSLVGSLCRLENFCEVVEVEEQLKERKVSFRRFWRFDALRKKENEELIAFLYSLPRRRACRNTRTWWICIGRGRTTRRL